MASHPSQPKVPPASPASDAAESAVREDGRDVLAAPADGDLDEALPVEGQMRTLRVLDADAAVAAEPAGEVESAVVPEGDVVVIIAELPAVELDPANDELVILPTSAAEVHCQATPATLTEPGAAIDLLSSTGALAAMDAPAPVELPVGLDDDTIYLVSASSGLARSFAADAAFGNPTDDLIFLDFTSFAKPENPGKGNGGGGGGDDGDGSSTLTSYVSGDPSVADSAEYNIQIAFKGSWTVELQSAFTWAADWISDVITGDIQDVFFRGKIIDDISITAELTAIDGEGGILGQAGPTAIRTSGYLPAAGKMEFDIADANHYYDLGLWDDIVVHEMLHTIGFGTVWDFLELVDGSGTSTPTFTGEQAMLAYADLLDNDDIVVATPVPLESGYGSGTDESHWDETVFGNEIMTGFINVGGNYVSGMTVASLTDLGYSTIDWSSEFNSVAV